MSKELIIFEDLPSKATPLNAYNLNHNFDVFKEQNDKTNQDLETAKEQLENNITTKTEALEKNISDKTNELNQNINKSTETLNQQIMFPSI